MLLMDLHSAQNMCILQGMLKVRLILTKKTSQLTLGAKSKVSWLLREAMLPSNPL